MQASVRFSIVLAGAGVVLGGCQRGASKSEPPAGSAAVPLQSASPGAVSALPRAEGPFTPPAGGLARAVELCLSFKPAPTLGHGEAPESGDSAPCRVAVFMAHHAMAASTTSEADRELVAQLAERLGPEAFARNLKRVSAHPEIDARGGARPTGASGSVEPAAPAGGTPRSADAGSR